MMNKHFLPFENRHNNNGQPFLQIPYQKAQSDGGYNGWRKFGQGSAKTKASFP